MNLVIIIYDLNLLFITGFQLCVLFVLNTVLFVSSLMKNTKVNPAKNCNCWCFKEILQQEPQQ